MARPVTVFTVSQFDGETMERTLAFSSYEKAYLDMKNEYLNYLDVFKEASITVVEHYIDDTSAMIRTEEGKEVWHLEEVVVDSFMEEREEHRNFHATITVPQMIANRIQKAMCWEEGDPEAYRMGEEETISYTATFENGYQMDIKCCGVKYEPPVPGDDNPFFQNAAWTEAVLYNASGEEITCSEASDHFFGTWTLLDERNEYTTEVKCSSVSIPHSKTAIAKVEPAMVAYVDWRDRMYEPEILGIFRDEQEMQCMIKKKEKELKSEGFEIGEEVNICIYSSIIHTGNKKASMSEREKIPKTKPEKFLDLYTAFQLTGITNDEIARLRSKDSRSKNKYWLMTGKQVRDRYDMRRTKVMEILPYISASDGKFEGFLFTVTDSDKGENK